MGGNSRLEEVTREHVVRAARKINAKDVRKWGVVVDGKEYPVKQLFMEAANLVESKEPRFTPADFISHTAVHRFQRLGFKVNYHEEE